VFSCFLFYSFYKDQNDTIPIFQDILTKTLTVNPINTEKHAFLSVLKKLYYPSECRGTLKNSMSFVELLLLD